MSHSLVIGGDGILRCSRYSFGPNRLHYCGPDANQELLGYIQEGTTDPGLTRMMRAFHTLYPYLELIAQSNGIHDPFDDRVVEAYWLGNDLLERVEQHALYHNLLEKHGVKTYVGNASFDRLTNALRHHAVPHHSFHVLGVWKRTGNHAVPHTLESLDSCRVSSGVICKIDGPFITVETEPLIERNRTLFLDTPITKRLTRHLDCRADIDHIAIGNIIAIHWGVPCEIITPKQAATLRAYTLRSIALANQFHLYEQ